MRFFAVALVFFGVAASHAQAPVVPHKMHFANMTLTIRDDARREIQKDVDAMTRHAKYFNVTAERARIYFPLISKIFAEENLPDDFKYLSLQESSLVPDAVSVSNAVGFWQFKDFTALSMGLRVDKEVDERMNIASASRGAANYLKKNNEQFDNWILALQAYQMGAGGVKRSVGEEHNGKRHFEVNSETYWYIKKFIAHKVAFENAIDQEPQMKAIFYESKKKKTLSELAKEVSVDEQLLKQHNKWALKGVIPDDKPYVVVIPNGKFTADFSPLALTSNKASKAKPITPKALPVNEQFKWINGLKSIAAVENETVVALAERSGISLSKFLKYNELSIDHVVAADEFYFVSKKKSKAESTSHKVKLGDDLWSISQQYGIQLKRLKKWNELASNDKLLVGSTIWLSAERKEQAQPAPLPPIETANTEVAQLESEAFNWDIKPAAPLPKVDSINKNLIEVAKEEPEIILGEPIEHIIVKGETFYSLAKQYNVSVIELWNWNNLSAQSKIYVGEKLLVHVTKEAEKVPGTDADILPNTAAAPFFHQVQESDTLYGIARQYGVTIKDLMDWNNKEDLTIKEGEKIRIQKK